MRPHTGLLLLTLASCGNPHLHKIDELGSKNVPVIGTPEELRAQGLRMNDGLFLKTDKDSISGVVSLQNMDLDTVWNIKLEFVKGENFSFNGTGFPGIQGTCQDRLSGQDKCLVDIKFHSKTPGVFADQLKVTYFTQETPDQVRELLYPLKGERIPKFAETLSKVSIKTIAQEDHLDFGKSMIGDEITAKLVVKNEGEVDVNFDVQLENENQINFSGKRYPGKNGTCLNFLKAGRTCLIEMFFDSSKVGLFKNDLVLTHTPVEGSLNSVTRFSILGEKASKKKQGPLVASEVFSNSIDFGKVKLGVEVRKQIEIQNLGETVYGIKDLNFSGDKSFNYSGKAYPGQTGTCGDVLRPGSCVIELAYRPTDAKKDAGLFKLTTKEGDSVELKLLGEGAHEKKCESYNEYLVVPEKSYPATKVIFPYLKSHPSTTSKLTHLYGLEVNGYVKELDNYVVKDGMVYVTYKLPKMEGEITSMNFGVYVLKVIQDNYKDTESLCLSSNSVRKCSGHQFSLDSWQALRNPDFWDNFKTPVSERYEKQFAASEYRCKSFNCMRLNTEYELSDIFELTADELKQVRKEGLFTLIFSDDTRMLKMPRIAVKTKVVLSCE